MLIPTMHLCLAHTWEIHFSSVVLFLGLCTVFSGVWGVPSPKEGFKCLLRSKIAESNSSWCSWCCPCQHLAGIMMCGRSPPSPVLAFWGGRGSPLQQRVTHLGKCRPLFLLCFLTVLVIPGYCHCWWGGCYQGELCLKVCIPCGLWPCMYFFSDQRETEQF